MTVITVDNIFTDDNRDEDNFEVLSTENLISKDDEDGTAIPAVPSLSQPQININMRPLNLTKEVEIRKKTGLDKDSFDWDVIMYDDNIKSCIWPDERAIHKELESWDLRTPTKECFDRNKITTAYARLNAYRHRLGELLSMALIYKNVATTAHKALKETAFAQFEGIRQTKEANASFLVKPFEIQATYAENVVIYLKEKDRSLEAMFMNMGSNLKHIDNLTRVNSDYQNSGLSNSYQDQEFKSYYQEDDIKTNDDEEEEKEITPKAPHVSGKRVRVRSES